MTRQNPTNPDARWALPPPQHTTVDLLAIGTSVTDAADRLRALLPKAVAAGMAYVPGAPFYCHAPRLNTLRLSFVTVAPPQIEQGVAALGRVLAMALEARP